MKKLELDEINKNLEKVKGWSLNDAVIEKDFIFKDFSEAFAFMTRVALIAETINHHPDWFNVYNIVTIKLSTHAAKGITDKDFEFAKKVEQIFIA